MRLLMTGVRAAKLLIRVPRELLRRLHGYVLPARSGPIAIGGVRFEVDLSLDPAMESMYFGTYQSNVMNVLRRVLRPGDTFIDVGANVGYVSAVALDLVGERGQVHAFEPVPRYFQRLQQLAAANPGYRLHVNQVALGSEPGTGSVAVTSLPNIGWNTMVPGFMGAEITRETLTVRVTTLSEYLDGHAPVTVALVKIDAEGFELPILRGFRAFLSECDRLPVIIAEVAPSAYARLGTELDELAQLMDALGYQARRLDGRQLLDVTALTATTDVLFAPRDVARSGGGWW